MASELWLTFILCCLICIKDNKVLATKFAADKESHLVEEAGCLSKIDGHITAKCEGLKGVQNDTTGLERLVPAFYIKKFGNNSKLLCEKINENNVLFEPGNLLEEHACTLYGYNPSHAPVFPSDAAKTLVNGKISQEKVREVDDLKQTVTMDITFALFWIDLQIKTNFSKQNKQDGGIEIGSRKSNDIWKPNVYVYNTSDYNSFTDSTQTTELMLLSHLYANNFTVVMWRIEAKMTVYCDFDLSAYPMDTQMCELRIGSRSSTVSFIQMDNDGKHGENILSPRFARDIKIYNAVGFDFAVQNFEQNVTVASNETSDTGEPWYFRNTTKSTVGIQIKMKRSIHPFIMKYYFPCIAIVVVSHIGYMVPLTAMPARVALLVTQLLTLTNLFIHEMVRVISFEC